MQKLVAALDKALGEDIQQLPWMSDATKKEAEAKLALFRNKIGYPDHWKDYSTVKVSPDTLLANIDSAERFADKHEFDKLGKPVDETEWGMTPPTVNAYYDPAMNDINFPAGILQPPFYDASKDPAVNFGSIGVVIGHEMTHGFDDEGSQFDGKGNLREWQTPEDRKAFTERTDCEVKEYSGFESAPGQNLNGKLTLGENTADNGGLRIAYLALMNTLQAKAKKRRTPATRWTASPLNSVSSSRSRRSGAVTRQNNRCAFRLKWIRTRPASSVPMDRCRTSTSSGKPLAASRERPCIRRIPAVSGNVS